MTTRWVVAVALAGAVPLVAAEAFAFEHVVRSGETLAQIAEHVYGNAKLEVVLVGANALDSQGGSVIAPGMRLEVPAPWYHTVAQGETWAEMALEWLGSNDAPRAELLARINKGVSWVPPVEGQEVEIPAVVTYIGADGDTVDSLAQRFWGNTSRAWEINTYNHRDGMGVRRGEVVLIPMVKLQLTEAGKAEAQAAQRQRANGGIAFERQRQADADIPQLLADVRYGRYAEAVARGNRLLGGGALTHPQLATIYRALLESYVALDAPRAASAACADWKANEPRPMLDPMRTSPKVRAACEHE